MCNEVPFLFQKSYKEEGRKDTGHSLYSQMPQTIETAFAKEVAKHQSDVSMPVSGPQL